MVALIADLGVSAPGLRDLVLPRPLITDFRAASPGHRHLQDRPRTCRLRSRQRGTAV